MAKSARASTTPALPNPVPTALTPASPAVSSDQLLPVDSHAPVMNASTPASVPPPSRHSTFLHPRLVRTNLTTVRIANSTGQQRLLHIGQVASYIAADSAIRAGRFNPAVIPDGYEKFAADFNIPEARTVKRFATFDTRSGIAMTEGVAPTLEDFNIDPVLIGWRKVLTPQRQRILDGLLWGAAERAERRPKPRRPTPYPTIPHNNLKFNHNHDNDMDPDASASMITV